MRKKYYTPEIEEFHVGFECETLIEETGEDVYKKGKGGKIPGFIWKKEVVPSYIDLTTFEKHKDTVRVKHLDREDIESLLNDRKEATGKVWKEGRNFIKGDAPVNSPWVEFVLEDASSIIINEYLHKVLIEKTFPDGRGKAVVFNGIIKNKSELKRVLKMIGV